MSITQARTEGADPGPNDVQSPDRAGRQDRRPLPRKRGRRGRATTAVVAVVAVAVAAGGYIVVADPFQPRAENTTIDSGIKTGVAKVIKGSLSARTSQNGTLGYAGAYKVVNKANGTVTKLPQVGDAIREGQALYWVDGKPVILLAGGSVPVYRALSRRSKGADVKQVNRALVALGYATKSKLDPHSDYFGWRTVRALAKMQDDVGLEATGKLPIGQVVFLPAKELRITNVTGVDGTSAMPNQSIMEASSTARQVTVKLRASQQTSVAHGDAVTVTLPNGKTTPGKVSSVGKVATKDSEGNVTVEVLIRPLKPKETGLLDQAPVQVSIVSETVKKVLSVPVNALLALAGGGFAVEVVDSRGVRQLIPVETGLFDNSAGRVEVSGKGLAAGQNVVVPA
jgi:hypothetical protein